MIEKKEEVLRQLKLVRKARGISYQMIADGTEDMGMAVSLSSVKRVFAENSQARDFRYESTIRPIVRFVMGIDGDVGDLETLEEAKASVDGLTAVVDFKDSYIARLEADLDRVREDHRIAVEKMEAAEARKVAYLREEIQRAREDQKVSDTRMARWRTAAILFLALFVSSLLLVIAYLITDRSDPGWGIFWTENPAPLPLVLVLFGFAIAVSLTIARKKK